jgi:glycosyltransferase involved in cell wall biosynthesis
LLKDFSALRLYFLGEGPHREKLESMARTLGVEKHCRFTGFVQPIAPILKRSACVVLPTLSEGLSVAALEAMAVGTPVVASGTGGLTELITSDEDGLLFPPADLKQLQQAIHLLLEKPKLREALGRRAQGKVRAHYASEQMIERTVALYQQAVEERRSASI